MRPIPLAERIAAMADKYPDGRAVVSRNVEWRYRDVLGSARMVAGEIGGDSSAGPVVVWSPKSPEVIAAVIGCGLAGWPVIVPSPHLDRTMIERLMAATGARVLLRVAGPSRPGGHVPLSIERHDAAAGAQAVVGPVPLVLTTSGSTGAPKVVPLGAEGVGRFVEWASAAFGIGAATAVLSYAPLNFDVSLLDVWTTLHSGGTAVLVDSDLATDAAQVADALTSQAVAVVQVVPMVVRLLSRLDGVSFPAVERLILTGEALPPGLLPTVRGMFPRARVYNVYGCTETNDSYIHEVGSFAGDGPPLPIGRPIDGVEHYLRDPDSGERIDGPGTGELVVSTPFQSDGYLDRDLTTQRFVTEPASAGGARRFYLTGDIVRRDADGVCHLNGRVDFHVKVRGVRTNLAEVEHVLQAHPDIHEAAVVAVPDELAGRRIHAAIHAHQGTRLNSLLVRQHIATVLPRTAIPSTLTFHTGPLPKTASGKVDRSLISQRN